MKRVIVLGIGGASCSGKTLLAKHIRNILPSNSTIVHQDDFAPPIEQVPYSSQYPDLQDWDDPPTCILWEEFRSTLRHIRNEAVMPDLHQSHDHLNKQVQVGISPEVSEKWRLAFQKLQDDQLEKGVEIVWFLVDGFVLYWDKEAVDMLDVRLFLRVPYDILKKRREERQVYVLQNPDDAAAGGVWVDPPQYFDKIVYPAYVKAHEHIFESGDVEHGAVVTEWAADGGERELVVLHPLEGSEEMTRCVDESCTKIFEACERGVGTLLQGGESHVEIE